MTPKPTEGVMGRSFLCANRFYLRNLPPRPIIVMLTYFEPL